MTLNGLFSKKLQVVNVGLELFYDDLVSMGCKAVQTKWSIPTTENPRIKVILEKFKKLDEENK